MTDSPNQPADKSSEAHPPDLKSVDKMLEAFMPHNGPMANVAATTPIDSPTSVPRSPGTAHAIDHRSAGRAFTDGVSGAASNFVTSTATMAFGVKAETEAQLTERHEHNAVTELPPNIIYSLVKTGANIALHPGAVLGSVWDSGANFLHTMAHGTTNQKFEAFGAAAFAAGTMIVPLAGKLGKLGTEGEAAGLASKGLSEASAARSTMADYQIRAGIASDAAVVQVEQRSAAAAAERALTAEPVVSGAEALTPTATTADIGARLHLPAMAPLPAPSGLASRIKSLFGSSAMEVDQSNADRFANLFKAEKPIGTLANRIDGLKSVDDAGAVTSALRDTHLPYNAARPSFVHVAGGEPIEVPGGAVEPAKVPVAPIEPVNVEGAKVAATPIEPVNVEGAKVAATPIEPVNVEGAKVAIAPIEPVNVEGAKVAATPIEPVNVEGAKVAIAPIEPVNVEGAKVAIAPIEPVNVEGAKVAATPIEPVNVEGAKVAATPIEPVNVEGAKVAATPIEPVNVEGAKVAATPIEPVNVEGAKVAATPIEPVNVEGAKVAATPIEPVNVEGAKVAATPIEPVNVEGAKVAATPIEPVNVEGAKVAATPIEPVNVEGAKVAATPIEPVNVEGAKVPRAQIAPPKVESMRAEGTGANSAPSIAAKDIMAKPAPNIIASRASNNLESLVRIASEENLALSPEVGRSLDTIGTQLKAIAESTDGAVSSIARDELSQNMASLERALASPEVGVKISKNFAELKASVHDLAPSPISDASIAPVSEAPAALAAKAGENLETFNRAAQAKGLALPPEAEQSLQKINAQIKSLAEGHGAPLTLQASGQLAQDLATVERSLVSSGADAEVTEQFGQFKSAVQDLSKAAVEPEHIGSVQGPASILDAQGADLSPRVNDFAQKVQDLDLPAGTAVDQKVAIGGVGQAEIFQQKVDGLAALSKDMQAGLPATGASQPVTTALKNIEGDLATIKGGAKHEAVFRKVQANIERIEGAGAGNIATELKQNLGELENASTTLDRAQRLETTFTTIQTEGSALESQSARLSQKFADEAVSAPSTSAVVPTNAQVSEQLQLISRQAKLLDGGEAGAGAITKIKDAFTRVEEMTAPGTLTEEQSLALQEMKASIAKIDQASVEAAGLRRLDSNTAQIAEQSGRVESLTGRIAKNVDLTTPAAVDAELEQRLNNINQAAQDVRAATTLDEQVNAVNKMALSVQDSELQAYLTGNKAGLESLNELKATTAELHESVSYRALERSKIVARAEAENAASAARALEASIQNDIALANSSALQTATTEYRTAAESFAQAPDQNLAAAQMEQKLAAVQGQLGAAAPTSTAVIQSEEMAALLRAQAGVSQSVADSELLSRNLINRRLPVVDSGFNQIGKVDSTVVQREIMRDLSGQIQNLRYLESRVGPGADQLSQAQMQLTRAQNDLEVATYRRNLVKLAAGGDQGASDRLLIAGLTSDGFKANSMVASAGPAARLVQDFARNRTILKGLAASDPLFVNNSGWLSANAIRNTGYTLMGVGGITFGVGYQRNALERAANLASPNQVASGSDAKAKSAPAVGAADTGMNDTGKNVSGTNVTGMNDTGKNGTGTNVTGVNVTRVIGHSAGEPNGFSPNGQTIVRSAFTQDIINQALPRSASSLGTVGSGSDNLQTSLSLVQSDNPSVFRPTLAQLGPFPVYTDDVNMNRKLYNLMTSGTLFGLQKAGDPADEPEIRIPLTLAQSLKLSYGGGKPSDANRLDKPATSQFAIPLASLSSPFALGLAPRRDALSTRLGGSTFGGASGSTTRAVDSGLRLASLSDNDVEEGGAGAGTKHLKGVERTESKGIDASIAHSGAGSTGGPNNGNNDEDNGNNDPTANATVSTSANSPAAGRRVPPDAKPESSPAVAVSQAQLDEQKSGAVLGAPPRRRASKDAISA